MIFKKEDFKAIENKTGVPVPPPIRKIHDLLGWINKEETDEWQKYIRERK